MNIILGLCLVVLCVELNGCVTKPPSRVPPSEQDDQFQTPESKCRLTPHAAKGQLVLYEEGTPGVVSTKYHKVVVIPPSHGFSPNRRMTFGIVVVNNGNDLFTFSTENISASFQNNPLKVYTAKEIIENHYSGWAKIIEDALAQGRLFPPIPDAPDVLKKQTIFPGEYHRGLVCIDASLLEASEGQCEQQGLLTLHVQAQFEVHRFYFLVVDQEF